MNPEDYNYDDDNSRAGSKSAKTFEEALKQEDEDSADELPDLQAVTYGNYNDLEDLDWELEQIIRHK